MSMAMTTTRITSRSLFMLDILSDIRKGRLAPASFQRPFVWKEADVEALWSSILKGYPLGSILCWDPENPDIYSQPSLGPIPIDPSSRRSLILDGQNRLVSIAWSITPPDQEVAPSTPGYELFRGSGRQLVLDPLQNRAYFANPDEIAGMIMPIHYLAAGTNTFLRTAWQSSADDDALKVIDDAGYRLREAQLVQTTIAGADLSEAREAFLHITKAGVPISSEDFDAAVNWQPA